MTATTAKAPLESRTMHVPLIQPDIPPLEQVADQFREILVVVSTSIDGLLEDRWIRRHSAQSTVDQRPKFAGTDQAPAPERSRKYTLPFVASTHAAYRLTGPNVVFAAATTG